MTQTYINARKFIYKNARPLDLAIFKYHFEEGTQESVLEVLSFYQNEDGGFSGSINPNISNPKSTPAQTYEAVKILHDISYTNRNHPIIKGILRYLESGDGFDGKVWAYSVPSNNDSPCAHWWSFRDNDARNSSYAPSAALAGFILRFADKQSSLFRLGRRVAKEAFAHLMSSPVTSDSYLILSYMHLVTSLTKAGEYDIIDIPSLVAKLKICIGEALTVEPSEWLREGAVRPSLFIKNRNDPFYAEIRGLAEYECDFLISNQNEDGSFPLSAVWMSYPEQWAISSHIWMSSIAIKCLKYLKNFERL